MSWDAHVNVPVPLQVWLLNIINQLGVLIRTRLWLIESRMEDVGDIGSKAKARNNFEMTDITEDDFKKYLDPTAQTQYTRPYNDGEN